MSNIIHTSTRARAVVLGALALLLRELALDLRGIQHARDALRYLLVLYGAPRAGREVIAAAETEGSG